MFTTVLFDLDGTLLNLDIDFFLRRYIKALTPHFLAFVPPEKFADDLMRWSYAMVANLDPALTNLDVFWSGFPGALGVDGAILEAHLYALLRGGIYQTAPGRRHQPGRTAPFTYSGIAGIHAGDRDQPALPEAGYPGAACLG